MKKYFFIFVLLFSLSLASAISVNYPTFFQEKETQIIVGNEAARSDYIAAIKLSNDLSYDRIIESGVTTTKSSISNVFQLGSSITSDYENGIDYTKLKGLKKKRILFQGENYDVSDVLFLSPEKINVKTSLNGDQNYGSEPVLEFAKNSINYYHRFDKSINLNKISPQNPLRIGFLGDSLLITKINSDNSFNVQIGESYLLGMGDSATVGGKIVSLENIDSNGGILIKVGEVSKIIPKESSRVIEGIDIFNEKSFYVNEISERSAKLIMGENVKKTFSNEDPYIAQDKNNPKWIWSLGNLEKQGISIPGAENNGEGPFIGIKNNFELNDFKDKPPKKGECVNLPNNYVSICFEDLLNDEYKIYNIEIERSTDLSKALGEEFSKVKSVKLSTQNNEGLIIKNNLDETKISSTKKTNEVYLYAQDQDKIGVFYKDSVEKKIKLAGYINQNSQKSFLEVKHSNTKGKDVEISAEYLVNKLKINLNTISNENSNILDKILIDFKLEGSNIKSLGERSDSSEESEVIWNEKAIGTRDKDSLTNYGIIIKNTKNLGNSDKVRLEIPNNQVKAKISILGPEIIKIEEESKKITISPEVYFDNQILGIDKNTILVGGPCANSKVEEFFEISCKSWNLNDKESIVKVKEINNNVVLLIAGTSAQDTKKTIDILEDFGFDFKEETEEVIFNIGI